MSKSANEACELLEETAMNNYQWPTEMGQLKMVAGMMELDAISMLTAQVAALTKQLQKTTLPSQAMQVQNLCELCGTTHPPNQCPALDMNNMPMEEVQAIGNYQRQPNNPNSMSYNLGWKNHPNFSWFNTQNTQQPYPPPQPQYQPSQNKPPYQQQHSYQQPPPGYYQPENRPHQMLMKPGIDKEESNDEKDTEDLRKEEEVPPVSIEHHVRIPYPQRLHKHNLDKQFAKFLEVFKKLHINISFAEALEQMPSYVKFMMEILSNKRKMGDYETISLTEVCSAILQRKLPQKLRDPGSFTIPCMIGEFEFDVVEEVVGRRQLIEDPLELSLTVNDVDELKVLPEHLCYAYLGEKETLLVIVSSFLLKVEEEKLLRVLRAHKIAIGWTLTDIRGISPSTVMHRILMEDDARLTIDAQ
ncbi:uncharacterized protein LOC133785699 [Humulus lupulus]|uniref:uncharacterized protein LOC133785699 n=1 Tax=Humulus lupulus TaxID=3486 RepID=UPI002B40EA7A|nr:uncharacterized protein LOC133785699 [Humulus lupulus]